MKWFPIVDEYSREALNLGVDRSITAQDVVQTLDHLVAQRGVPEFIRSDNGPEPERSGDSRPKAARRASVARQFAAKAVKDGIALHGFRTCFIAPGSPWQNAYVESFNSRFRDEFLNLEVFGSLLEAKVLGEQHRYKYNHQRPHSSLGDLTPAEFASRCPLVPQGMPS